MVVSYPLRMAYSIYDASNHTQVHTSNTSNHTHVTTRS